MEEVQDRRKRIKYETYNDHLENAKRYNIPRAQLIIADIPYNLGKNAYASSNEWYEGGDNKNGESDNANNLYHRLHRSRSEGTNPSNIMGQGIYNYLKQFDEFLTVGFLYDELKEE